ncbi:MAG TPA: rod shape-determining protein [Ruminococcaceae bacterium]|nr:rod shape-determining protein [Oscillospiraceae bacterium]
MLGKNIGIDLGTTSVIIFAQGKGIVLNEPSVVAYNAKTNRMCAVGKKAFDMLERNPDSLRVVQPMRDGVVSDFTATRQMLSRYLSKVCSNSIFKPNIIVCMPSSVTNLEKRTVLDIVTAAGAGRACLMEEPLAAAIGAGIDITNATGTMIVDIGGGTTDIAVISLGSIAVSKSIKVAGNLFDEAIIRQVRRERDVIIGHKTAEELKTRIGCAVLPEAELWMTVKGKHYINNLPATLEVSSTDCFLAMREYIEDISEAVRSVLEITPPELVGDIGSNGIVLTGGGALLRRMSEAIQKKTGIKTRLAEDARNCVAKGIGKALGDLELLTEQGYIFKNREEITGFSES